MAKKGKIEKDFPAEFEAIKTKLFDVWDNSKGVYSDVSYNEAGRSLTRFLFDSFYAARIRIGDGIGLDGEITIPDCHDKHIETALASLWRQYPDNRPVNFTGK